MAGIATVMLVGACGGDEDETATATAEGTTEATAEATTETTAEPTAEATTEATTEATAEPTDEATAEPAGATVGIATTELGDLLVGPDGRTLYLFTNDEAGMSNCADGCAAAWPPLTVEAGTEPEAGEGVTGTLGTIERADGTMQVTINDVPLYYYATDAAAGDTTGQGVNDVWFVLAADGTAIEAS